MAGIIDRRCAQEWYLRPDEEVAALCGRIGGRILGVILGAVAAGFVFLAVVGAMSESKSAPRLKPAAKTGAAVAAAIASFLVIYFLFGAIGGFSSRRQFQAFELDVAARMNAGMSRADAIRDVQAKEMARMQANATTQAGGSIAAAMLQRQ